MVVRECTSEYAREGLRRTQWQRMGPRNQRLYSSSLRWASNAKPVASANDTDSDTNPNRNPNANTDTDTDANSNPNTAASSLQL